MHGLIYGGNFITTGLLSGEDDHLAWVQILLYVLGIPCSPDVCLPADTRETDVAWRLHIFCVDLAVFRARRAFPVRSRRVSTTGGLLRE